MSGGVTSGWSLHLSHHQSYNQPDSFLITAGTREEKSREGGREGEIVKKASKQGIKQERYKLKKETHKEKCMLLLVYLMAFFSLSF